jgi:hypothetical protein
VAWCTIGDLIENDQQLLFKIMTIYICGASCEGTGPQDADAHYKKKEKKKLECPPVSLPQT